MRGDLSLAALLAVAAAAPAMAQPAAPESPGPEPEPPAEPAAPESPGPESEPEPSGDVLEVSARIAVRDTLRTTDAGGERSWLHARTMENARLALDYERGDYLKMQLDVEFRDGEVDLKDAYIRVEPGGGWRVVGGRFKRPMSFIGLESSWSLPTTERGLLSDLQLSGEDLPFTGERGQGVLLRYELPLAWEPQISAALVQNPLGVGPLGLDASEHFAQDVHARVELEPAKDWTLAAALAVVGYLSAPGMADSFRHAAVGSLESQLELAHLRLWAEAYAGQSPFADDAALWAGRVLASVPFEREAWPERIEPFALAQIFDPDAGASGDRNAELGGGLDLGFSKHLRLQVEGVHRFAEGAGSLAIAGTDLRVQLAARFSEEIDQ